MRWNRLQFLIVQFVRWGQRILSLWKFNGSIVHLRKLDGKPRGTRQTSIPNCSSIQVLLHSFLTLYFLSVTQRREIVILLPFVTTGFRRYRKANENFFCVKNIFRSIWIFLNLVQIWTKSQSLRCRDIWQQSGELFIISVTCGDT